MGYVTASFGQGIWMTSIQLIRAYSALANGGRWSSRRWRATAAKISTSKKTRGITEETSETIAKMLASVVDNGFWQSGQSSRIHDLGQNRHGANVVVHIGYQPARLFGQDHAKLHRFFPGNDPKFLVLVKIKSPNVNTAEYSAIPVFNESGQICDLRFPAAAQRRNQKSRRYRARRCARGCRRRHHDRGNH